MSESDNDPERLLMRIRELEEAYDALLQGQRMCEKQSLHDPFLTELLNPKGLLWCARKEEARRLRFPSPLAYIVIDIDDFTRINHHFSILAGDFVLRQFANVLISIVRGYVYVCRYSGDQFVVLSPETSLDQAKIMGDRISLTVKETPFSYEGMSIPVTVTVGVAVVAVEEQADLVELRRVACSVLRKGEDLPR
jgi:diguanylate cyclase (GGDEF)-like protein